MSRMRRLHCPVRQAHVAVSLATALVTGCASDGRSNGTTSVAQGGTNGALCQTLVTARCQRKIRCDEWDSSLADCQTVEMPDCCEGMQCDVPNDVTAERLQRCVAAEAGTPCDESTSCAYVDLRAEPRGAFDPCSSDGDCNAPTGTCFETTIDVGTSIATSSHCTLACMNDDDCPAAADGRQAGCYEVSGTFVCYQRCSTDSDCPQGLVCTATQSDSSQDQLCLLPS